MLYYIVDNKTFIKKENAINFAINRIVEEINIHLEIYDKFKSIHEDYCLKIDEINDFMHLFNENKFEEAINKHKYSFGLYFEIRKEEEISITEKVEIEKFNNLVKCSIFK